MLTPNQHGLLTFGLANQAWFFLLVATPLLLIGALMFQTPEIATTKTSVFLIPLILSWVGGILLALDPDLLKIVVNKHKKFIPESIWPGFEMYAKWWFQVLGILTATLTFASFLIIKPNSLLLFVLAAGIPQLTVLLAHVLIYRYGKYHPPHIDEPPQQHPRKGRWRPLPILGRLLKAASATARSA